MKIIKSEELRHALPDIIPVILAGGEGRRLRPLSRPGKPKPFLRCGFSQSLLQKTASRFPLLQPPVIVSNQRHIALVQKHLDACDVKAQQIFLEPEGRGTAAAVAVAAHYFNAQGRDPLFLVMPSDHLIRDPNALQYALLRGAQQAREGRMVLFGVTPRRPATGFGYIQCGAPLAKGVHDVMRFVEKPAKDVARHFIAKDRNWFWNSGIFLFSTSSFLMQLRHHAVALHDSSLESVRRASRRQTAVTLHEESFRACPPGSLDRLIMEKDNAKVVMPVAMGWRDLGTWPSLLAGAMGI